MAIITSPGTRISDAANVPVNGGKFRVYLVNTTTLASLYSDPTLTTPRANPVVANSAGELPFFFLASGSYDTAQLDASDNVLDSQDDVPAWGDDSGTFERVLPGNARLKITGSAGASQIQAGDPDPDDVGGTLTIEGWEGTQLDNLTLDAATTGLTGDLTVKGGKKLTGVVQTAATTFTAAASVDIELVNDPTGVRAWRVDMFDMTTTEAGGDALQAQLSFDASTYKSGAADYAFVNTLTIGASVTPSGSTGATAMVIAPGFETGTNRPAHLVLEIITPTSGNDATTVVTTGFYTDPSAATAPASSRSAAWGLGSYGRATHIRILAPAASTITGKYRVTPLYGFGE